MAGRIDNICAHIDGWHDDRMADYARGAMMDFEQDIRHNRLPSRTCLTFLNSYFNLKHDNLFLRDELDAHDFLRFVQEHPRIQRDPYVSAVLRAFEEVHGISLAVPSRTAFAKIRILYYCLKYRLYGAQVGGGITFMNGGDNRLE